MEEYIAHIRKDGKKQTVQEHLLETAKITEKFAQVFYAGEQGYLCGIMHDIGKYSEEFQKRIHEPEKYHQKVDHATAGAREVYDRYHNLACAMVIMGHHSGLSDIGSMSISTENSGDFFRRIKKKLCDYSNWKQDLADIVEEKNEISPLPEFFKTIDTLHRNFAASMYIKMLYSCLVDADFLDTEKFMSDNNIRRGEYEELETLLGKYERYIQKWLKNEKATKLEKYRTDILKNCMKQGEVAELGVYTFTVPTGGGKTISSLGFALCHAVKQKEKKKRIIYVVPYTSIIDQIANEFCSIFGKENVLEHHSNVEYEQIRGKGTDDTDILKKSKVELASENWDAPIIITTAVQFFESLYGNRNSKCRKLHNIAESVVVFDEVQTLPTKYVDVCMAAIAELSNEYKTTSVLCTATQPALQAKLNQYLRNKEVREIAVDVENSYEFFKRVEIHNLNQISWAELIASIRTESSVLVVLNTRSSAQRLYKELKGYAENTSFCLTTYLRVMDRKQQINEIKAHLDKGEKCIVISTSLIESGVDLDFRTVYRQEAGLPSLLQCAGRCNRNGRYLKEESKVYSFSIEGEHQMNLEQANGAMRQIWRKYENINTPEAIEEYYQYYRDVLQGETVTDKEELYTKCMQFEFKTVAKKFKFIEQNTRTIYVIHGNKEAENIIAAIKSGTATKQDYRGLQKYGVTVYEYEYIRLLEAGDISNIEGNIYILENMDLYDTKIGLMIELQVE